ncbi:MAG: nucleoside triphosphate pyrophosphohydrolase family protein [Peptostreptococcaceae bacterium]|nr:nucleoside triphosphate pyrophosphohydrolase family protein [Peptostreptococcaceae bacterium]
MKVNEYQKLASRTINCELSNSDLEKHALFGMVGEIGEIHSIYQKTYQGHRLNAEHLEKELGDLLWFIAEFCTANEWKLEDIMQMNIDKLKLRFPSGFTVENSIHRKETDI